MANTYPKIIYPRPIIAELQRIEAASKVAEVATSPAIAPPQKNTYLTEAPWYALIVGLLVAVALVYQVASIPILAGLGGSFIGGAIAYQIEHSKWRKRMVAHQASKISSKAGKTRSPLIYPDWSKVINLTTSLRDSEAQKGLAEKYFLDFLKKYFSSAAFGCKYENPETDEKYWYSSDIEIILDGIGLQVEIDEPYDGRSYKPHHCCDKNLDARRDAFFLSRSWAVVRFAEVQTVEQPLSCCVVVASVIYRLTGDSSYLRAIGKQQLLKPVESWTSAQAAAMAATDFRRKYLIAAGLFTEPKK